MCTVALARRLAPLQRRRGLATLADALGIEVAQTHRALPDAETCARVLCALLPRLCANARTVAEALALLRPRRPPRYRPVGAKRPRDERPDLTALPKDPGVYIFRDADGQPLYVGKSVCLRTRARAHFTTPATWTGQAEHVDYQPTESELGALVLENRLIKALKPPGNTLLKREADGYVYLRCRLDIPFPILEVAREPAAGHAVCVGPVRGRAAAAELVEQLNSLFGLRHCGRALPRRPHPSAYGQMGRCLSPCLGDLDPNLYRERLDEALRLFEVDGGAALLAHVDAQMRAAVGARSATSAPPGCAAARAGSSRCCAGSAASLRAAHAGARLVLAPHPESPSAPTRSGSSAAAIADWGPLPPTRTRSPARTEVALAAAPAAGLGGWLPADELDEARIVGSWLAGHEERARARARPARPIRRRWPRSARARLATAPRQHRQRPQWLRSCAGAGLVAGAGRRSSATTCVTGTPVKRATRCGKSCCSHFELRPGSVQTTPRRGGPGRSTRPRPPSGWRRRPRRPPEPGLAHARERLVECRALRLAPPSPAPAPASPASCGSASARRVPSARPADAASPRSGWRRRARSRP